MSNAIIKNIITRRTIKPEQCTGERIDDAKVWQILECANWAPTHGYTEPWRFVVFSDERKTAFALDHANMYRSETATENFKQVKFDKIINRAAQTSHVIALIMKRGDNPKIPEIEEICAAACGVQNMQLAAHSLGLGAYWGSGGMTFHPKMHSYLKCSPEDKVLGFLYLGVPSVEPSPGRRITPIEEKVVWKK